jgi:hypothetical protein
MAERLWLDDRRKPPWGYSLWAKTADEAIEMLRAHKVEHCSLDHDLAEEHYEPTPTGYMPPPPLDRSKYKEKTGYAVLEWMAANREWVLDISIHTLSERGGDDMELLIEREAPNEVKSRRVKPYSV